ncbi:MAG: MFS transporter [Paenibacillus sp. RIFOXYA1_FULL_44_5]|nr:MAG: MFS transporter [Paenibacillus sp. RIFOXYA1_FULL_44_5]
MKTAIWLYLFIFVAFFDLHAQFPILTPFAISLGAAPSFIGLIMGIYSITHIPGNLLAGYGVDRFGSKPFMVISLIFAGILLLFQSNVSNPWTLLIIRSISGFVLAFLSPASLSLLAKIAKNRIQQGHLMSGNGIVHTLASVVSPAAGALLVAKIGFTACFTFLGWALIITGIFAIFGVKEKETLIAVSSLQHSEAMAGNKPDSSVQGSTPWLFFGIPLAISCAQGILFFELPLMKEARNSILTSGILFSLVSFGALITLSLFFLNRYSPYMRTIVGSFALALTFFGMAIGWPLSLTISLLMIGMAKGIIFPSMATLLASMTREDRYGRIFSLLSISFSIGAFLGPVLAGQLRDYISPYYIAFLALMIALTLLSPGKILPQVTSGKDMA